MKRYLIVPHSAQNQSFDSLLRVLQGENIHCYLFSSILNQSIYPNVENFEFEDDFLRVFDLYKHDPRLNNASFFRDIEVRTGVLFSSGLRGSERTLGYGFASRNYLFPSNSIISSVTNGRYDPQRLLAAGFLYCLDFFQVVKIDKVIIGTIASGLPYCFALAAKSLGVPLSILRKSRFLDDRLYVTSHWKMMNTDGFAVFASKTEANTEFARDFVEQRAKAPASVKYIADNWRRSQSRYLGRRLWHLAIYSVRKIYRFSRGRHQLPMNCLSAIAIIFEGELELRRGKNKFLEAPEALPDLFVYLPMHKEPELANNWITPEYQDQMALIRCVAASMPFGFKLVVKEHPFNLGRRPRGFYDEVENIPNVYLAAADYDQFDLIRRSCCVVTDNGSSGFEALLMGKKMLMLGSSFYSPLAERLDLKTSLVDLDSRLSQILALRELPENTEEELVKFVESEYETTVPDTQSGIREILQGDNGWNRKIQ
jgi:hypothetical protein